MLKIDIDATEFQEFTVPFEGEFITITLNFRQHIWLMNAAYKEKKVNGLKLSSGVLMLVGKNFPFEIVIDDKGSGLDPFSPDNFEKGIFDFYILERDEISEIRGFEVE